MKSIEIYGIIITIIFEGVKEAIREKLWLIRAELDSKLVKLYWR